MERIYTIRAGERVRDDVAGGVLVTTEGEIIKICEAAGSGACVFFDSRSNRCTIYEHRPLECRVLRCWDTDEIRRIYRYGRLDRRALIGHIDGLWDLVAEHEQRCGAGRLFALAERRRHAEAVDDELRRMVGYDEGLRQALAGQGRVCAGMLDFLLGRPLTRLLLSMRIGVQRRSDPVTAGATSTERSRSA